MTDKPTGALIKFAALDANAEVIGGETYIGELPPARMALPGQVRRVYLAQTANNDPVLKVLYEVTEGKYTGFTAWDNVTLNNKAAFKWKPLIDALGVSTVELTTGTRVNPDEESDAGLRVISIGKLDLSGNTGVPVYFGVNYRNYEGTQQTSVAGVRPRTRAITFETVEETADNKPRPTNPAVAGPRPPSDQ